MRTFVIAVALSCTPLAAFGQDALVLSGGGARGLAHAGVLPVVDAACDIAPGIVVGTSMGAVIGALYASGYTGDDIIRRIDAVPWRSMFDPAPVIAGPDQTPRFPMLMADLQVERYRFSRGLVGQWRINRLLSRLLFDANARSRGDFDAMPRRFRPLVADLNTGEAFAIAKGDLALAVRASMSVPGFFAPVVWNERVLVDGGIAANLPVGVARALGAAHVTAVNVVKPPADIHSYAPFAVIERAVELMIANAQRDAPAANVLIVPDLPATQSAANFPDDPSELIEAGRDAARRVLRPGTCTAPTLEHAAPPGRFTALHIDAPDNAMHVLARRHFEPLIGVPYDTMAVLRAMDRLYATGLFEGVWPSVTRGDTLVVQIVSRPLLSLAAAGRYDNDRGGRAWVGLERVTAAFQRPALWSVFGAAGELERSAVLSARLFSNPFAGLAYSAGVLLRERDVRSFSNAEDLTVTRAGGWLMLELPHLVDRQVVAGGVRSDWIRTNRGAADMAIGPVLRWAEIDPPGRVIGVPSAFEAEKRWGDVSYQRLALAGSQRSQVGRLFFAPLVDLNVSSADTPADQQPSLGDDHLIPGLRFDERRGAVRVAGGLDLAYPVMSGFVRLRSRIGVVGENLEAALEAEPWIGGSELGLVLPTPLGALEVGYARATLGRGRFDIAIGQRF